MKKIKVRVIILKSESFFNQEANHFLPFPFPFPFFLFSSSFFSFFRFLHRRNKGKWLILPHCRLIDGYGGLDREVSPPADFVTYQPSIPASGQFKFSGCHVSSDGHFMHTDCYEKFESMYIQGRPGRRQFFLSATIASDLATS